MSDFSGTESSITARSKDDRFRIMVATDIHLGYGEKNQILSKFAKSFALLSEDYNN